MTNFGIITDIMNNIINTLPTKKIKYEELIILKNNLINLYDKEIIEEIFNRLFIPNYNLNKKIIFTDGQNCFREFEELYPDISISNDFIKLEKQFNKLKLLPQPEQRTKEWFIYRYNRITASDTAAAIDCNPYETVEEFILKKCDPNHPFRDNDAVYHGKKYEPIATMLYEHIYNTRVFEFGALPSEKYIFLGASPDGICSKYTLDNKFSSKFGTMLEIKCPVSREIITKGEIIDDICPYYYYCQIQQQLECCELDICDFWQCKISEYNNKNEFMMDKCSECINTENTNGRSISINDKLKKGIILEFYPKNFKPEFDKDIIKWKSKYIYPKRLDLSIEQYNNWILKILDEYYNLYPDIHKNYYFNKIIYWKLEKSHNVSIPRNIPFLEKIIPILEITWYKVVYYRKNQDKLDELKDIVKKRKKYVKINANYKLNNYLLTDKIKFLNNNFKLSSKYNSQESDIEEYNLFIKN